MHNQGDLVPKVTAVVAAHETKTKPLNKVAFFIEHIIYKAAHFFPVINLKK